MAGEAVYTYGPVPSRRLGRSVGVSLIPHKTCPYSCIYCQLGRTRERVTVPRSFYPREDVLGEIRAKLSETAPDYITFVGDGEPTLSSDLGWLIGRCKAEFEVPVAVITNGALLFHEHVRRQVARADVVMPSLDAGSRRTFRAVNRPHPSLDFEWIVNGLIAFRKIFHGQLRLEVMLVRNVNDSDSELRSIRKLAWAIHPDRIDVAVPTRPPSEPWVLPPEPERILEAQRLFRSAEKMTRPEDGEFDFAGFSTFLDAVCGLSQRHPLRMDQAARIEAAFGVEGELEREIEEGLLTVREYGGRRFVVPVASR